MKPRFKYWPGGDRPVDGDKMVEVITRGDDKVYAHYAAGWDWTNTGHGSIWAYRVIA